MANSVTYICFVQDHSGSMESKAKLAVDNFNEQRAKLLKEDDDAIDNLVTIIEFDDNIHCNIENEPIAEIKKLKSWWTGGMTALYDAIGQGINNIKKKMDADKREDKAVLLVIQTDGFENASSDYAGEEGRMKINKLINELEDTKLWSFVFLGENIDKAIAMGMGFKSANIMSHQGSEDDIKNAYGVTQDGLSTYMNARKVGQTQTMSFYSDDGSTGGDKGNDNNS